MTFYIFFKKWHHIFEKSKFRQSRSMEGTEYNWLMFEKLYWKIRSLNCQNIAMILELAHPEIWWKLYEQLFDWPLGLKEVLKLFDLHTQKILNFRLKLLSLDHCACISSPTRESQCISNLALNVLKISIFRAFTACSTVAYL